MKDRNLKLLITVFLLFETYWCQSVLNELQTQNDKQVLYGHSYKNLSDTTVLQCSLYCIFDCSCLSFQLCGRVCQLCSSSQLLNPEDMREDNECSSYYFVGERKDKPSCFNEKNDIGCCATSQPCLNDGTCHAITPTNSVQRYRCACLDGYHGDRCQDPCDPGYGGKDCQTQIKSCHGYAKRNGVTAGEYVIIQDDNKVLPVFCDFDKKESWTLIQSYSIRNNYQFRYLSLMKDAPVNNDQPSWESYRLSKNQISSIKNNSTKWRFTCNYDTDGVVYTDYMAGLISKVDIFEFLIFSSEKCIDIEYVDVRGTNCSNCRVCAWQYTNQVFHIDTWYICSCEKAFKTNVPGFICPTEGEDNFGWYLCQNPAHRCSANEDATTQIWLGNDEE